MSHVAPTETDAAADAKSIQSPFGKMRAPTSFPETNAAAMPAKKLVVSSASPQRQMTKEYMARSFELNFGRPGGVQFMIKRLTINITGAVPVTPEM